MLHIRQKTHTVTPTPSKHTGSSILFKHGDDVHRRGMERFATSSGVQSTPAEGGGREQRTDLRAAGFGER